MLAQSVDGAQGRAKGEGRVLGRDCGWLMERRAHTSASGHLREKSSQALMTEPVRPDGGAEQTKGEGVRWPARGAVPLRKTDPCRPCSGQPPHSRGRRPETRGCARKPAAGRCGSKNKNKREERGVWFGWVMRPHTQDRSTQPEVWRCVVEDVQALDAVVEIRRIILGLGWENQGQRSESCVCGGGWV